MSNAVLPFSLPLSFKIAQSNDFASLSQKKPTKVATVKPARLVVSAMVIGNGYWRESKAANVSQPSLRRARKKTAAIAAVFHQHALGYLALAREASRAALNSLPSYQFGQALESAKSRPVR